MSGESSTCGQVREPGAGSTATRLLVLRAFTFGWAPFCIGGSVDGKPYQTSINRLANKALADVLRLREAGEPVMLVLLDADEGARAGLEVPS